MHNTMSIDTKWFRDKLQARQLSQRRLARQIGIDPAGVSLLLRGQRRMQLAEAAAIARELGCTLNDVLEHAGIEAGGAHTPAPGPDQHAAMHGQMNQVITLPDGRIAVVVVLQ